MNNKHTPLTFDFRATIRSTGLFAFLSLSLSLQGADVTKADNADALNLTSSWVGLTLPGAQDRAVFNQTVTGDLTTPLGVDSAWSGILLTGTTNNWVISGSNQLSLGTSGLTVATASGNLALAAPLRVALTSAQTWSVASNREIAVSATVSGPANAALTKAGEGTLTLSGDSTFSGGTILGNATANTSGSGVATPGSGGVVVLGNSHALGSGTVSARGLQLWGAVPGLVVTNAVIFDGGGLRFGGSNDLTFTGPISLPGDRGLGNYSRTQTLRLNGPLALGTRKLTFQAVSGAGTNGTIELNGPITGSGILFVDTIYDNGIVVVSADNTGFTGTTSINGGALRVAHTNALGRTGSITLANSGARLELANGLNYPRAITVADTGNAKGLRPAATATNVEFSGAIAVAETTSGNFELTADAGQTLTVSGAITGSGAGVEKLGEGTLVLPNANTFTDTFLLGNGTANQSGTGAASSGSGGFVLVSNNTSLGLGVISAKGAQLQAAADGLVIPNKISIDGGALRFSGTRDLELSGLITNTGTRGIGNYSGKRTLMLSGTITAFPGYDITFQGNDGAVSNGTVVAAGAITGGGNLTIDTTFDYGLVIFAGNNSYTGRTSVSSGTLRLDYTSQDNSKLSDTSTLSLANATLELVGGSHLERVSATTFSGSATITRKSGSAVLALGSLSGSGNLHLSAEDIASTTTENTNGVLPGVTVTAGGATRWAANSGVSDGNGGFLIRAFAGTPSDVPRLGGILPDDASQNVRVVNGGTEGSVVLSAVSNKVNTLTVDASEGPVTLALAAGTLSVGGESGGGVILAAASGALAVGTTPDDGVLTTGGTDNGLAAALVLANDNPTQPLTVNAAIKNNGTDAVSLTKSGAGTVVLAATNTYTGGTVIREGTLQVGNGGTGGQLGTGALQNNGLLLFNRGAGSADLLVTPALSGPGSVTQNSASGARVILRGAANSFYGGTVVNSGTLRAEDTASDDALLQLGTGPVTLNGATLEARSNGSGDAGTIVTGDGVKGNDVVVNASSTLDVNRYNGTTRIRNTILFNTLNIGSSQLTVSGANEYRASFAGDISLTGNATFNTSYNDTDAWFSLDGTVKDGGNGFGFTKLGVGTLALNGANTFSGATYLGNGTTANTAGPASQTATASSGGFVLLGHNNALGSGTVYSLGTQFRARVPGLVIPNPVVVSNGGFRFGGTQSLTFSGALTPVGASRTLANYSADKTLTLGDIRLDTQSVTFEATSGALTNGTTLVRGVISSGSGLGAPTVVNSYVNGRVIFANTNTYATTTTIQTGATLQLGDGGTAGSLNPLSTIANSGTLAFNRSNEVRQGVDFNGRLTGTGGLSQEGAGTLILTNANTYTGPTRIKAGATLQLGYGGATGALSPSSVITDDGVLSFNRTDDLAQGTHFAAAFGGAGGLVLAGTGTVSLTGTNFYAGPSSVRAGTLLVNGDQSSATGTVSVLAGATLGGTGTLGGAIVAATNSLLAPGVSGVGTLKAASLTLQDNAIYRWDVSPATNDVIEVWGDLTLPASFTLNVKRLAPGSIRNKILFRYGGTYSGPKNANVTATGDSSAQGRTVVDTVNKQVILELLQTGTVIKLF